MTSNLFQKSGNFIRRYPILYYPAHFIHLFFIVIIVSYQQFRFFLIYKIRCLGYRNKKFRPFGALRNKYLGKRCFIVCTGPSLLANDLDALQNEICFSMNSIFKIFSSTTWRPTYYCLIDPGVYDVISKDDNFINMKNALIPDLFLKRYGRLSLKHYIQFPLDANELKWHNLTNAPIKFTDNAEALIFDVATVTYTLMQIAVYMGFKEIYLLGCDCNYSGEKQHFSDYGLKVGNSNIIENNLMLAFSAAKKYTDTHGIKIYNATRGGNLEIFDRVNFDTLFEREL